MARCPNCQALGSLTPRLAVNFTPILRPSEDWRLLDCPDCACLFYERNENRAAQYDGCEMLSRGRTALYLQQGAGLSQLLLPLARVTLPAGARFLDIGCGFGFTLDFAREAKGWDGLGIDPGGIAALGRARLGVPIEQREVAADEPALRGTCDVVLAAETIEHLPQPAAFLALARGLLREGGILILTTPNADLVTPGVPEGLLATILSPELHIVLQSKASLAWALRQAGFAHVHVVCEGASLVGYASDAPIMLADDADAMQETLDAYLERRATAFVADRDLSLGFAGRALLDCANRPDPVRGARVRAGLEASIQSRFGMNIATMPRLPAELGACSLERMAELVPLNLGAILYAGAMLDLQQGAARGGLRARLVLAAQACRALRRATGELGMEDALSEDLEWVAGAEALLCSAEIGQAAVPKLLAALSTLAVRDGVARRRQITARCFTTLVNAGHFRIAREILPLLTCDDLSDTHQRDAMYCQGVCQLQPGGDAATALGCFIAVRGSLDPQHPDGLFWPALRGEVQALTRLGRAGEVAGLVRTVAATSETQLPADLALRARSAR
jgi:2-polyprenyl-3-methyl-5-hydroxy-6-metoxy-1,4-benzoquinol methylase